MTNTKKEIKKQVEYTQSYIKRKHYQNLTQEEINQKERERILKRFK